MAEGFRITYATMSADNEELHKQYDEGIELAKAELGKTIPIVVNGEEREGEGTYELRSPVDSDILLAHRRRGRHRLGEVVRDRVRPDGVAQACGADQQRRRSDQ
jgi:1-pyrroline-5-carboxylate dehydrogenase